MRSAAEVLETGGARERELRGLPLRGEARGQEVAAIGAQVVGGGQGGAPGLEVELTVGEAVLADPLVVGGVVEGEHIPRAKDEAQLASGLVHEVGAAVRGLILPEAVRAVVERGHGQGHAVAEAVMVGGLGLALAVHASAQAQVGALGVHGVARIEAHQSTLGVHAVEGALRSAQDVDALQGVEVLVVHALRDQGDAVDVHADGRTALLGADAADVGNVAKPQVLHVGSGEEGAAQGLCAQPARLLGLGHDDDLVEVDDAGGVSPLRLPHGGEGLSG